MRLLLPLIATILATGCVHNPRNDKQLREYVYNIHAETGMCTGVQVRAPSGKVYLLTASHCRSLLENGSVLAQDESGKDYEVSLVKEDPASDLLLLTSPSEKGVSIASSIAAHERLHSMTHGGNWPSHRGDGEYLGQEEVLIVDHQIESPLDLPECSTSKFSIEKAVSTGIFYCCLKVYSTVTTVPIQEGSSGGPLLNDSNQLVGIASATSRYFSDWVLLEDIKTFLKDK